MVKAFIRFADGSICADGTAEKLKQARADEQAIFWVDFCEPTEPELAMLSDVFGFHPLAIKDVTKGGQNAKIEPYDHGVNPDVARYYFMVVYGPGLEVHDKLCTKELDFFSSQHRMVTVHRRKVKSVTETIAKVEKDPKPMFDAGIDMLLYTILDQLTDDYFPILDTMQAHIDKVED